MNALAQISVANARIPQTYANAKSALNSCVSIDECQSWADKAAALASYAKQANDDELMKMATRIRDRAIRRAGELLKQIKPASGARSDLGRASARGSAASDAGMSSHQAKQAVRVANVPDANFERQVESESPPTVTALASQGTKRASRPLVDLEGRDPKEFNRSMHFVGAIQNYAAAIAKVDLDLILPGLTPEEVGEVRTYVAAVDAAHDRIITRI